MLVFLGPEVLYFFSFHFLELRLFWQEEEAQIGAKDILYSRFSFVLINSRLNYALNNCQHHGPILP